MHSTIEAALDTEPLPPIEYAHHAIAEQPFFQSHSALSLPSNNESDLMFLLDDHFDAHPKDAGPWIDSTPHQAGHTNQTNRFSD